MATLTIRNVPQRVVDRLKEMARSSGRSMEQEIRTVLDEITADRASVLRQIEQSWTEHRATTKEEVDRWLENGWSSPPS